MNNEFALYKYFKTSGTFPCGNSRIESIKEIIFTKKIYVPRTNELNDPYEVKVIRDMWDLIDYKRVLSFTISDKNPLMWSHYADSHKGVMIKFKQSSNFHTIQKVQYVSNTSEIERIDNKTPVKMIQWSYEQEYRHSDENDQMPFIPLSKLGLEIDGVILGSNISNNDKNKIISYCTLNNIMYSESYLGDDTLIHYFLENPYTHFRSGRLDNSTHLGIVPFSTIPHFYSEKLLKRSLFNSKDPSHDIAYQNHLLQLNTHINQF